MMTLKPDNIEPDWGMDIGKSPQLEIQTVNVHDGVLHVLGRVVNSIKVGDRFKHVEHSTADASDDEVAVATVNLRVKSISAYRKNLNRVNAGMSAELQLTGEWDALLDIVDQQGDTDKVILRK